MRFATALTALLVALSITGSSASACPSGTKAVGEKCLSLTDQAVVSQLEVVIQTADGPREAGTFRSGDKFWFEIDGGEAGYAHAVNVNRRGEIGMLKEGGWTNDGKFSVGSSAAPIIVKAPYGQEDLYFVLSPKALDRMSLEYVIARASREGEGRTLVTLAVASASDPRSKSLGVADPEPIRADLEAGAEGTRLAYVPFRSAP